MFTRASRRAVEAAPRDAFPEEGAGSGAGVVGTIGAATDTDAGVGSDLGVVGCAAFFGVKVAGVEDAGSGFISGKRLGSVMGGKATLGTTERVDEDVLPAARGGVVVSPEKTATKTPTRSAKTIPR